MTASYQNAGGRRIHVAHVIFKLDIGGLENGLVNVINGLASDRFEHTIICLDSFTEFRNRIKKDGVRIVALQKKPGLDPRMYFKLWKQLRELRPDIVHTRNLGTLPCSFFAAAAGVPVRIHGEHGWDMVDIAGQQKKYKLLRRLLNRFIDVHVAVSKHISNWLSSVVGIDAAKIVHICNGVDTRRFHPRTQSTADSLDQGRKVKGRISGGDLLVVGTVGRLETVKDHKTLIEAICEIKRRDPKLAARLSVVVVGDGILRDYLEQRISEGGVGEIVTLCGRQDDIPERLRHMDVFVLSSLNEGISNTILEAMASGLPVVATAVGGNPEIVSANETGLLVPASDVNALSNALLSYLQDDDLRARHGQLARTYVEQKMSLEVMVKAYHDLYTNTLLRTGSATGRA